MFWLFQMQDFNTKCLCLFTSFLGFYIMKNCYSPVLKSFIMECKRLNIFFLSSKMCLWLRKVKVTLLTLVTLFLPQKCRITVFKLDFTNRFVPGWYRRPNPEYRINRKPLDQKMTKEPKKT